MENTFVPEVGFMDGENWKELHFSADTDNCHCRQDLVTSFSAGKLLSPSPCLSKWTSNIIWIKNLRTCSMIKQPTFLWHHHFFPLQNDIWETSVEIPYWWHVTTQIWVVLLMVENLLPHIRSITQGTETCLQYWLYAFFSQTSFCTETSGSVAKINQGHPTSIFRKYLFGKRFEI